MTFAGPQKHATTNEDYSWDDLLVENRIPMDYQIQCYVEALRKDLVAVLPTGAGKTMIASMLVKRMREMDPERMGLFIVDRIPLVFQQRDVSSTNIA